MRNISLRRQLDMTSQYGASTESIGAVLWRVLDGGFPALGLRARSKAFTTTVIKLRNKERLV